MAELNLKSARVALRDRTLIDVLDLTVRFLAAHAKVYAVVTLLVLAPAFAVTWGIGTATSWLWGWFSAVGVSLFAQAPFTALASKLMFDDHVRARDAVSEAARALPTLIATRVLQIVAVGMGLVFFLLPAAWFATALFFVPEVVVLEKARWLTALNRGQRLASVQFGDAMLCLFILLALEMVMPFLGDAVGRSLLEDLLEIKAPEALTSSGGGALSLLGFWLFIPFSATARFLTYINFRTRSEGWDIQTRFASIVAGTEGLSEQDGSPVASVRT